jgi:hypothetical protein
LSEEAQHHTLLCLPLPVIARADEIRRNFMINFRKAIAFGLAVASLGMGVAATSTPTVAEWDFQHRNLSSGFNNYDEYWGPGVGGVAPATTYDVYEPNAYEPSCYFVTHTAFGKNGFAYYAIERVCQ